MALTTEEVIIELKYYQMYIGKAISYVYINDKICDFFDLEKEKYNLYACSLGEISSSLIMSQRILFSNLLLEDKGRCIPKLLNKLDSNQICDNTNFNLKIKTIVNEMKDIMDLQAKNIEKLKEYRHKVYAHFDKGLFNTEWQKTFVQKNDCDFDAIINTCIELFEKIYELIVLLGGEPFGKTLMKPYDINYLISRLKG